MKGLAAVVLAALPTAGRAQQFDPKPLRACIKGTKTIGQMRACVGVGLENCATSNQAGPARSTCAAQERIVWSLQATQTLDSLAARDTGLDAEDRAAGKSGGLLTQLLEDTQTTWTEFRDAHCAYQATLTFGAENPVDLMECSMQLTAQRAMQLLSLQARTTR